MDKPVSVRFVRGHGIYNTGEVAGFQPEVAKMLVASGVARRNTVVIKGSAGGARSQPQGRKRPTPKTAEQKAAAKARAAAKKAKAKAEAAAKKAAAAGTGDGDPPVIE